MSAKPIPHIADSFLQQAELAEKVLEYGKAIKHYETALAILEVAHGPLNRELIPLIFRLLDLYRLLGDFGSMIPLLERSKEIIEEYLHNETPSNPLPAETKIRRHRR